MFHLGEYADQRRVSKLFIAGAVGYKSTVLLLRQAQLTDSSVGVLNVASLANTAPTVH